MSSWLGVVHAAYDGPYIRVSYYIRNINTAQTRTKRERTDHFFDKPFGSTPSLILLYELIRPNMHWFLSISNLARVILSVGIIFILIYKNY